MAETVPPEFERFIKEQRDAGTIGPVKDLTEGKVFQPVFVESGQASELVRVAAKKAVGLFGATKRTEVVWVKGDSELAVNFVEIEVKVSEGLIQVFIPVRCDQAGSARIEVAFVVGTDGQPAGLYASTYRRPNGPPVIVEAWGESLVAFAWQCVLGLVSGVAGATGKDVRGNILVPVELTASDRGLQIVPMARYRFSRPVAVQPGRIRDAGGAGGDR